MNEAAPAEASRWGAARQRARAAVAQRLGERLATTLLPPHPAEPTAVPPREPAPPSLQALAADYQGWLGHAHRKRQGAWFTPAVLAEPTAARALAPLLARGGALPVILDPAAGGGAFLLAALGELRRHGVPAATALGCLHGLDRDPTAAALAALAVWEAAGPGAGDPLAVAARVRAGDGLHDLADASVDAVLTNPPWETLQGDPAAAAERPRLRQRFHHQGRGKLYTYRLFVERAVQLLRPGGRFGLLLPASLWFDRDAAPLRALLLDECQWEWLFGFENRRRLFAIDSRYRFGAVVGERGGRTDAVRVAFGRVDPAEWAAPAPPHALYPRRDLAALSPHAQAFVEVDDARDLAVLRRAAANSEPLLGPAARFVWRQGDYNLTAARERFVPAAAAAAHRPGTDGVFRAPGAPDLLPLYQGAMLYDLQPNAAGWAGGTGHGTRWQTPRDPAQLAPAFFVAAAAWQAGAATRPPARVALRALSNATNERTAIACLLPDLPCGNSLGVFAPRGPSPRPLHDLAALAAVLSSLPFDWLLRLRLGGTNLNGFVLADCLLPRLDAATAVALATAALRLCAVLPWHGPLWTAARAEGWLPAAAAPAGDAPTRAALHTAIDTAVGRAYGLDHDDVAWLVRGADLPAAALRRGTPPGISAKGFWRIDRSLPPPERRPNRWLAACR